MFINNNCTGCSLCSQFCPQEAIFPKERPKGSKGYGQFKIDHTLCINCGECQAVCEHDAVQDDFEAPDNQKSIICPIEHPTAKLSNCLYCKAATKCEFYEIRLKQILSEDSP